MRGSAAFRAAVAPGGVLAGPWVRNELWRRARAVPSLDLRFAENKSLGDAVTGQSLVTFTRASSGIYVGSDGLIKTATTDEARFDHNPATGESLGLLVEESRTNLLTYSEQFDNADWARARSSITANTIVAPDGTLTGDKWIQDNGEVTGTLNNNPTLTDNTIYTLSVIVKAGEWNTVRLRIRRKDGNDGSVVFNIETQTFTHSKNNVGYDYQELGNGWYRVWVSVDVVSGGTSPIVMFLLGNNGSVSTSGDGTSGIYIWGAQLEAGAFPTSYIPTTTAAVTRAADVASITGTNFNTAQFARASTATFYNSSGIITTANVDIPRNNYNPTTLVAEGLLLEPQRSNIVLQSNGFDTTWSVFNGTVTASAGTSPDGTNNAWELKDTLDVSPVNHNLAQGAINHTAGKLYTVSLHVKAGTSPRIAVIISGNAVSTGNRVFTFDMTTETFAFSANTISGPSFTKLPNSWYRLSMTYIADATDTAGITIRPVSPAGSVLGLYQGDGTGTILLYGAQIEEGPDATSYIPTTTTEVTRSADVPAVSPWYRQDEGTILYDQTVFSYPPATNASFYAFSDGTGDNRISGFVPTGSNHRLRIDESGSNTYLANAVLTADVLSPARVALGFKTNDVNCAYNGTLRFKDQSATIPLVDRLNFGEFNAAIDLSTRIKRFIFWPQRLSDSTLANITQ